MKAIKLVILFLLTMKSSIAQIYLGNSLITLKKLVVEELDFSYTIEKKNNFTVLVAAPAYGAERYIYKFLSPDNCIEVRLVLPYDKGLKFTSNLNKLCKQKDDCWYCLLNVV